MDALSFELFYKVNRKGTVHELWESRKHIFGDSSTWDDGKFKKEDEPKVEARECVEHDHNLVIMEDCSTSWSSDDDDDRSTTCLLDKIDDDASSDANDDATPCTLDGDDDGSCSDDIATTSPFTTPHCFMSQGNTKVSNANVVDHVDSYDELVSRLASMTMSLENKKAETMKWENKNSFLKNSCEEHKKLIDVLKSSYGELKLTHETLLASHEELLDQHASPIKLFFREN
jgi:post-segregation antitoxin (ccd killing protein)